jgi:hypothetical protein
MRQPKEHCTYDLVGFLIARVFNSCKCPESQAEVPVWLTPTFSGHVSMAIS